jgi:hypothetical protein
VSFYDLLELLTSLVKVRARMVQMDIGGVLSDSTPPSFPLSPPSTSSSSSTNSLQSTEGTNQPTIRVLEREFQLVRQHIRLLMLKKSKILREIHTHKHYKGSTQSEQDTINRWKAISVRYAYARDILHTYNYVEENITCFPLFDILPNEVLLHIWLFGCSPLKPVSNASVCSILCDCSR